MRPKSWKSHIVRRTWRYCENSITHIFLAFFEIMWKLSFWKIWSGLWFEKIRPQKSGILLKYYLLSAITLPYFKMTFRFTFRHILKKKLLVHIFIRVSDFLSKSESWKLILRLEALVIGSGNEHVLIMNIDVFFIRLCRLVSKCSHINKNLPSSRFFVLYDCILKLND